MSRRWSACMQRVLSCLSWLLECNPCHDCQSSDHSAPVDALLLCYSSFQSIALQCLKGQVHSSHPAASFGHLINREGVETRGCRSQLLGEQMFIPHFSLEQYMHMALILNMARKGKIIYSITILYLFNIVNNHFLPAHTSAPNPHMHTVQHALRNLLTFEPT